jgi:copper chaperone CopZ
MFQVSEPVTVELNVTMHCEACAEQLKGKILKMRGILLLLI